MLKLLLCLSATVVSQSWAQLVTQDARTRKISYDNHSAIEVIANVRVKVETEERSDEEGKVILKISSNNKGTFAFKGLNKNGYTLISPTMQDILSGRLYPLNDKAPIDIILADKLELQAQKERIISMQQASFESRIRELENKITQETDTQKREQKENQLSMIYDQYDTIIQNINDEAEKLSKIDCATLDERALKSLELRKQGKATELISYNLSQLPDNHENQMREISQAIERDKEDLEKKKALGRYWATLYYNIAYGYQMNFDYSEAAVWLKKCCDIDPENYDYKIEYADIIAQYQQDHAAALPLYQAALELALSQKGELSLEVVHIYRTLADCYVKLKKPREASESIEKMHATITRLSNIDHPFNDIALEYYLAGVHFAQQEYEDALDFYFAAVGPLELQLGREHKSVLICYHNIAVCYASMGQHAKALEYYLIIEGLFERQSSPEKELRASNFNDIAMLYVQLNKPAEALGFFKKALDLLNENGVKNNITRANVLAHMGRVYESQQDDTEALSCYQQAHDQFNLLSMHQKRLEIIPLIATIELKRGNTDLALDLYLQNLSTSEHLLEKHHDIAVGFYNGIAACYRDKGRIHESIEYLKKSLVILSKHFDEDHPATAVWHMNMGLTFVQFSRFDNAITSFKRSLAIRQANFSNQDPRIAECYINLGITYYHLREYNQAIAEYEKALKISESAQGKNHPFSVNCYTDIGFLYYLKGDYKRAETFYKKALSSSAKAYPNAHPQMAKIQHYLGLLNHKEKRHKKAIERYTLALDIYTQCLGEINAKSIDILINMSKSYHLLKDKKQADEHRYKALRYAIELYGNYSEEASAIRFISYE